MNIDRLIYEKKLWQQGYQFVAGIDEVGRGPLAGAVYACAIIFEKDLIIPEVQDSKKLSEKKRKLLFDLIKENAVSYAIGTASEKEIDTINIRQASFLAMRRAVEGLNVKPDYLLVDGFDLPDSKLPSEGIIKGDDKSFTIAAASIIAKVSRDAYMKDLDKKYPNYKFAINKGYGTKEHIEAIKKYGITPVHRKTFLTKIIDLKNESIGIKK
jgi:ribonuclease HII